MRTGWVAVGVVLLILGFVLWYLPISISAGSNDVPALSGEIVEANPPLALLTPNLPYTATWSSDAGTSVNVTVYDCGTDSGCSSLGNAVTSGTGASGSLSWSGAKGHYYAVVPSGIVGGTHISVNVGEPLLGGIVGLLLVIVGLILLIVGVARKAAPRSSPPPMPPAEPPAESS